MTVVGDNKVEMIYGAVRDITATVKSGFKKTPLLRGFLFKLLFQPVVYFCRQDDMKGYLISFYPVEITLHGILCNFYRPGNHSYIFFFPRGILYNFCGRLPEA